MGPKYEITPTADNALRKHFDTSISDEGVHVLDPFGGTGTFMVRLLQSGLIKPHDLARKYANELHTNEILRLAYYIAAINIEATYHDQAEGDAYQPFPGIVYTDTFQLIEDSNTIFGNNSERARSQQALPIRVIVGNPPYSGGQDSANDNNANLAYPVIDKQIKETYVNRSAANLKNSMYDSYIRALRWASDRIIGNPAGGVVAYVTNGGYIDDKASDGLRLAIADEFHHLYVYNLRGNQKGDWRKNGGKIFGSGSTVGVAIMLAVREPGPVPSTGAKLHYRDIGDNLNRDQKLGILAEDASGADPLDAIDWQLIHPNQDGDWINQRSETFRSHDPICEPSEPDSLFVLRSNGLKTSRDAWNYNSSRPKLEANLSRMVSYFNSEVDRFTVAHPNLTGTQTAKVEVAKQFLGKLDPTKFSWNDGDFKTLVKGEHHPPAPPDRFFSGLYRPFERRHINVAPHLNNRVSQISKAYPNPTDRTLSITVTSGTKRVPFSALVVDRVPDQALYVEPAAYFPIATWAEGLDDGDRSLDLWDSSSERGWHSNITPKTLTRYQMLDNSITDEDVFFYVYGILHSPNYRLAFVADLKKSLPRIPRPMDADQFWAFSKAGRSLADLHIGYENVEPWPDLETNFAEGFDTNNPSSWLVEKMRHPKVVDVETKKKVDDKTSVVYNSQVTITGIPERAHEYVLGARSAIGWVLNQYKVDKHKDSGIVNDPNDWAAEHDKPTYIFDLLRSVVTVSMRTLEIIDDLPELDL